MNKNLSVPTNQLHSFFYNCLLLQVWLLIHCTVHGQTWVDLEAVYPVIMETDDVHEHHSIFTGQDQMPAMLQHIMLHEMLAPDLFALLLI